MSQCGENCAFPVCVNEATGTHCVELASCTRRFQISELMRDILIYDICVLRWLSLELIRMLNTTKSEGGLLRVTQYKPSVCCNYFINILLLCTFDFSTFRVFFNETN